MSDRFCHNTSQLAAAPPVKLGNRRPHQCAWCEKFGMFGMRDPREKEGFTWACGEPRELNGFAKIERDFQDDVRLPAMPESLFP